MVYRVVCGWTGHSSVDGQSTATAAAARCWVGPMALAADVKKSKYAFDIQPGSGGAQAVGRAVVVGNGAFTRSCMTIGLGRAAR